jgi:hypothetical protein
VALLSLRYSRRFRWPADLSAVSPQIGDASVVGLLVVIYCRSPRRGTYCESRSELRKFALKPASHSHNLDPLVGRRVRMDGIQQLLFAQTDRLKAFWRNLESSHEHVAD